MTLSALSSIVLAGVLVLPTLLSGCGRSAAENAIETGVATLGSGGVAVYESYDAKAPLAHLDGPPSAMRITRWQLRTMLAQADAGMGMTGATLDAFERAPANSRAPRVATFIGAWVKRGDGALATYAAQFMPKNADYAHPARVTFPLFVVTLFIADAARVSPAQARASAADGFRWEQLIAAPARAAVGCSDVKDFVDGVITAVTKALQVSGNGHFASIWNTVVAIVVGVGAGLLKAALAPIFAAITTVATVLAMVTTIASSLEPWTVNVTPDPATLTLLGTGIDGTFTANLNAASIDWPDGLKDCAKALAGIDLDAITYVDAPVEWETMGEIPGSATIVSQQKKIGADKTAVLAYRTLPLEHEQKPECSSLHPQGIIIGRAWVERSDIQHLQAALATAVLAQMPNVVRQFIAPMLQPWIDSLTHSWTNLLAAPVTSSGHVDLTAYERDDTKCVSPPPVVPSAPATSSASAPPGANPMVGSWGCLIKQHVDVQGVSLDVDIHADFVFAGNGTAFVRFPHGTSGKFGAGGGHVQADQNMIATDPGPYTYEDKGNHSGVLHFATAASTSSAETITFSGPNAYSTIVTSPPSGKQYLMRCKRK